MKQYILLLFIMIPLLSYSKTDMEKLLERVDHAIEMDSYYQQQKEKELKRLRRLAGDAITAEEELRYLDSLYRAYSTYRYDSSCAYVKKDFNWPRLPITPFILLTSRYTGHPCCRWEDSMPRRKAFWRHSTLS